ncbi:hypothetical protein [Nostoc commune]|uniref:hypothetical protein n=1 Tax=Nostoc commune TaxID=1178 RepID=UPI001E52394C|nr:hypothetical protein [Nostoc commune]
MVKTRRRKIYGTWLTAIALLTSRNLEEFGGRVSNSGVLRQNVNAAIDESVATPVKSYALFARFSWRGETDFADKLLLAIRYQFGEHDEKANS